MYKQGRRIRLIRSTSTAFLCFVLFHWVESEVGKSTADDWSTAGPDYNRSRVWPFTDTKRCSRMKTRDTDYQHRDSFGGSFPGIPSCGLNRFSNVHRHQGDFDVSSAAAADDATDQRDWLKEYREYLTVYQKAFSRWEVRAEETRKRRDSGQRKNSAEKTEVNDALEEKDADQAENEDDLEKELLEVVRIVGGHKTEEGEWPWLVAVGTKALGPRCGGSVIGDRWILTAAHCFQDEEDPCTYNVRIGSINWMYDDSETAVDVTPDAIYRHPDYDDLTSANDVALIRLSKTLQLNENGFINAICLPREERSVKPGSVCLAAGWGMQDKVRATSIRESSEVDLQVITYQDKCGHYRSGTMRAGMVCAGYLDGGKDTCQGDSGGPLIYKRDGRWTQLGITSFGSGCARQGFPGIYSDVGHFIHWISSVIERHS